MKHVNLNNLHLHVYTCHLLHEYDHFLSRLLFCCFSIFRLVYISALIFSRSFENNRVKLLNISIRKSSNFVFGVLKIELKFNRVHNKIDLII